MMIIMLIYHQMFWSTRQNYNRPIQTSEGRDWGSMPSSSTSGLVLGGCDKHTEQVFMSGKPVSRHLGYHAPRSNYCFLETKLYTRILQMLWTWWALFVDKVYHSNQWIGSWLGQTELEFETTADFCVCLGPCYYRHDFSHNKDNCRCCCILQSADEEQHIKAFLETSYTVLSSQKDCDFFFLHQSVCFIANLFVCTVWVHACHCHCVSGRAPWRTVFSAQADIRLTDIGGDSSTVAYGNRLLTAKTWHQRKTSQPSVA